MFKLPERSQALSNCREESQCLSSQFFGSRIIGSASALALLAIPLSCASSPEAELSSGKNATGELNSMYSTHNPIRFELNRETNRIILSSDSEGKYAIRLGYADLSTEELVVCDTDVPFTESFSFSRYHNSDEFFQLGEIDLDPTTEKSSAIVAAVRTGLDGSSVHESMRYSSFCTEIGELDPADLPNLE